MTAGRGDRLGEMVRGLRATYQVTRTMMGISAATIVDAFKGEVTRASCDERLAYWSKKAMADAQIDVRVGGREILETNETFVVMSNHQSHLDIPVLFYAVSPSMRMVAKTELFKVPIWGAAMHESGFIEIDRKNRERAISSLKFAAEKIRSGVHIWIAPEGTRSRTGTMGPFKKGGFMLALDTNTRILPIGISGTRDVLPVSSMTMRLGQKVGVMIGKPINITDKTKDELMIETRAAMAELCRQAEELRQK